MLDEFKHSALSRSDVHPEDYWDWLVLAQHHGLPTRLLDWSRKSFAGTVLRSVWCFIG
ncbi:MAG: FRG domain-containing protein [Collinsella sp.]